MPTRQRVSSRLDRPEVAEAPTRYPRHVVARRAEYDCVVVGSGPNGLAAAITVAEQGFSVLVVEGREKIGGGLRTTAVTLPGFMHDICSTILPLGIGSPFFRRAPLSQFGLEWVHPELPLAHPFDDGTAAALLRSIEETGETLGEDGPSYRRLMEPLARDWEKLLAAFLGPLRLPRYPLAMVRFGLPALLPATLLTRLLFRGRNAQALFAGVAAHAIQPLEHPITSSFGLVLGILGHAVGWPMARGGTEAVASAMARYLTELGGEIVTNHFVSSLDELPPTRTLLLDLSPRQFLDLGGERLPPRYRRRLERYQYGPGAFKVDFALSEPVPWKSDLCRRAGTIHVGGTMEEVAASERAIWRGEHPERPFVLVAQQSLFDDSRAPEGRHTLWSYCHVPNGSTVDMTETITRQIERFAPGFRECILDMHTMNTQDYQRYNPNYVGGDINVGVQNLRQLFTRPTLQRDPYRTPLAGVFLCSSATPPGGGVHGMCGYFAAQSALTRLRRHA